MNLEQWHGTPAGHRRHHRRGEPVCPVCREARNNAERSRRSRRGRVDPMAVERTINGDRPEHLTIHERRAVVAQMTDAGHSAAFIARRLGCDPRSVVRLRARTRVAA